MCLGAQAKAANVTARRNYKYQNQKREREWMQELNMAGVERIQYDQGINNTNLGSACNNQGRFKIDKIPVGSYTVTVSMIGYSSSSKANVNIYSQNINEENV